MTTERQRFSIYYCFENVPGKRSRNLLTFASKKKKIDSDAADYTDDRDGTNEATSNTSPSRLTFRSPLLHADNTL